MLTHARESTIGERLVTEVYLPDSCLQGSRLPAHLLWDRRTEVEVQVSYPHSLELVGIYNAGETARRQAGDNVISLRSFEVNGYVGLLFKSKLLPVARTRETVGFRIKSLSDSREEQVNKQVDLFRPELAVEHVPAEITVSYNRKHRSYELSEKISLRNDGAGTAILFVDVAPRGDFQRTSPEGLADFQKAFTEDLRARFDVLCEKWPGHARVLSDFLSIIGIPHAVDKKFLRRIRPIFNKLNRAFQENESFAEDLASAIGVAYFRNVQLITDLQQLMDYLNSIGEGRVVLWNSIEAVKAAGDEAVIRLRIDMTDLAYNVYEPLALPPIRVSLKNKRTIPIHLLFEWKPTGTGGGKNHGRTHRSPRR